MAGKKQKKIIPIEKRKKVIRLEERGREKRLILPGCLFGVLAVLSCIYCAAIWMFMGFGSYFFLIWGALGLGFGVIALLCLLPGVRRLIPVWLLRLFWICFGTGLSLFLIVEGMILSDCGAKGVDNADYLIVLGAQWKVSGPSKVLKYRLDEAKEYLEKNPGTKVIVSGGKGTWEPVSEAEGMCSYLEAAGIDRSRILLEDTSTNTFENLRNSAAFLNKEEDVVVIVTNNFHVFRAMKLAKGQGYRKAYGLAADSYPPMQLHNLTREFCGVVKDFLMGNFFE